MMSKRPTLAQKKLMKRMDLIPEEWLIQKVRPFETQIINRHTGAVMLIPEGRQRKRKYAAGA